MRTVNFFIIVFCTSLTYVDCKPAYGFSTRLLSNNIMRVKKRQEDSSAGYLEQCGIVTFPKAQQGVVNVLAFLDASWPYSHRQAIMLKMLNERLQKSGLPDTLFFVVNVDPSSARTSDNAEDAVEREAWLGVSPEEIETFSDIVKTTDSLATSMTPQIQLIQDNKDLEIWKDLRGSRDQVLVIDRCGKLTYQVIVPWSILHFPYVKAAILSTYKDEPCGPCDVIHNTLDPLENLDEAIPQRGTQSSETDFKSTEGEYLQNDRFFHVPDVPESNLKSSTADTSESGTTSAYLVSEEIDVIRETTTEMEAFDNPDNYMKTIFDVGTENELTTLESVTFETTGEITEIEPEVTTISNIFADFEAGDFSDAVTSYPIIDDQITSFGLKEKPPVVQNPDEEFKNVEEKFITTSADITHSTDSTNPEFYYGTTENFYTKDNVEDTTVPEVPVSNTAKFFTTPKDSINFDNANSTESTVEKEDTTISVGNNADQLDSFADKIYTIDQIEDTTAREISESTTSSFFKTQEKSTDFDYENSTQISVEMEDTTIPINSDEIQLDGIVLINDSDELTTNENSMFDASTEEIVTVNGLNLIRNGEETNENVNSETMENRFYDNSENEKQDTSQLSDMPLRIIMHAPHFHVDGDSTRMHEYLVLKTGSSDSHGHLASYDATRLYRGPQDFQETAEYLQSDEIESKMWPMTNVIYNRDESPGLYGEVADYWKNAGGQDNYDYTEETEASEIEQNTEEPNSDERISIKPSDTKDESLTGNERIIEGDSALLVDGSDKIPERLQADYADESITDKKMWSDEILNAEEEEKRSKLIAHYSKLLPWIYYVLDQ